MMTLSRWQMTRSCLLLSILLVADLTVSTTDGTGQTAVQTEADEPRSYKGHHVVRLKPEREEHLKLLEQLETSHKEHMEFWRRPSSTLQHVDIRLSPEVVRGILPVFNDSGLAYNIITDNLDSLITAERHKRSIPEVTTPESDHPENFTLSAYHTYEEISDWMDELAANCDDACEVFSIGNSYEGRPMKVIRIGKRSTRTPIIWIDAGLHAREWIAPATAIYIISKLLNQDKSDRVARVLVSRYTWYILPVGNPDGYHFTWTMDRLWRKTRSHHRYSPCRGVDANRNWDFHWGGEGTSSLPCNEDFRGDEPFSEPEARNIARFLLSLRGRLAIYLTLHSYGQYWLTPWGYTYKLPPDYVDLIHLGSKATEAMRRVHGSHYEVGSSSRVLYLAAGGSDDWAKGVLGVKYSYTVELRDTGRHGFILPPDYITMTGDEMLQAARSLSLGVLRERRRAARRRRRFN